MVVFLAQQAAIAALLWLTDVAHRTPAFRRILCTIMAGQVNYMVPIDTTVLPPEGSHLSNLFLAYTGLWHYARRTLRSLLITLLFEGDFKLTLSRRFIHVRCMLLIGFRNFFI